MRTEFSRSNQVKKSESLGVWAIYRVYADQTYRVNHLPEKAKMQVFVYTDFGQGILKCAEGEYFLEARTGLVFSADEPFSYRTADKQWHFWWFEFEGTCPCEKGIAYRVMEDQWFGSLGELALDGLKQGKVSPAVYLSCMLNFIKDTFREKTAENSKKIQFLSKIFQKPIPFSNKRCYNNKVSIRLFYYFYYKRGFIL